ncbi:unnamed protein product [Clonostachys rosea]|uniref:Zn(2)-C6 fungal-type domain-containing protein n=1 Tax=Bionectria ochroleuca TaxID=29856 RepID=A0ABY6UXH1_BIOOC|nr:unnamed protein product [Clonostachys rosea]
MSAPRRPHSKSRYGCLQCRKRRVKCDEAKPLCTRCSKRRETCSFTTEPGCTEEWSEHRNRSVEAPLIQPKRGRELYLMHHYTSKTCETMILKPGHHELFRDILPREAMQHEYLADGILAVAALHLATLEPLQSSEHIKTAMVYQDSGIRGFKEALSNVSDDNVNAIFSFSILIMIINLASTRFSSDLNPSENLVYIFELLRGVDTVVRSSEQRLKEGPFKVLLEPPVGGIQVAPDPSEQESRAAAISSLHERARAISKYVGPQTYEIYEAGIHSLETVFEEVIGFSGRHGMIIAWPVIAPHQLITLLKQSDPMALLIWIYYGVLTLEIHKHWWGRDFGVLLIRDLAQALLKIDQEWDPYIEWARLKAAKLQG